MDRTQDEVATAFSGPVFVVGMPRSGTKLLRNLLNRHPLIRIPEIETEFLAWLAHHIRGYGELSAFENFKNLFHDITRFPYFMYRAETGPVIEAYTWHAACRSFDAGGVFEALIRTEVDAPVGSKIIWGDKSPSYINDILLIAALYPSARFVHIVRDVRDYCLSIHRAWGKNVLRAAQRWTDDVSKARNDGIIIGSAYIEVRYEELIGNTEGTLRRLCSHLGVPFVPAMLTLDKPSENLGDAKGITEIVRHNLGKYSSNISAGTLKRIEEIATNTMKAFGYELVFDVVAPRRLSALETLWARAQDAFHLVGREVRTRGVLSGILFHLRYFRATRG
ncbi:MAG: sulfotransferase [Chloroflexota bacterium]